MNLSALVSRAVRAGAEELRLVPDLPAMHVRDGASSHVGDPCAASVIDELLEPLLSSEARMDLALGCAEWGAEIEGVGAVLVRAELRGGETHVAFFLDGLSGASARPGRVSSSAPMELELEPDEHHEITDLEVERVSISMPPVLGAAMAAPPRSSPRAAPAPAPPPAAPPSMPPVLGALRSPGLNAAQSQALAKAQKQPVARDLAAQVAVPAPTPPAPAVSAVPAPAPSLVPASEAGRATATTVGARELNQLLMATLQARGSDLHLSSGVVPMVRIDGDMRPMNVRGPLTSSAIEQMVWPVVPERSRGDFLRRRDADFAVEIEGHARFRANLFVDRNGIGAVFRVIPTQIVPAERLGLPQEVLRLCQLPKGLVLVTGPTGSGKSTTLASLIDYLNRTRSGHIVTIEDPIEFVFENKKCLVNQREVGTHTDSFRDALRAALREDPDVVLVGEMRDLETIEIALETAETGHLVFATLHTASAPAAVDRIIDQFPSDRQNQIRIMLAESLKGVVAQMLCRRKGGGRVAAFEVLFGIPAVAHLIRERKVFQLTSVMQTGAKVGMRVMNDSLLDLVKRGLVTPDEALSKTQDRSSLLSALRDVKAENA